MRHTIFPIAGLLLLAMVTIATPAATRRWLCDPPTSGSEPVAYHWQQSIGNGTWADYATTPAESLTITAIENVSYRLRVRASDAAGHFGPWSLASLPDVYTAPGACSAPRVK